MREKQRLAEEKKVALHGESTEPTKKALSSFNFTKSFTLPPQMTSS